MDRPTTSAPTPEHIELAARLSMLQTVLLMMLAAQTAVDPNGANTLQIFKRETLSGAALRVGDVDLPPAARAEFLVNLETVGQRFFAMAETLRAGFAAHRRPNFEATSSTPPAASPPASRPDAGPVQSKERSQ